MTQAEIFTIFGSDVKQADPDAEAPNVLYLVVKVRGVSGLRWADCGSREGGMRVIMCSNGFVLADLGSFS
jgi:hypothetical protein